MIGCPRSNTSKVAICNHCLHLCIHSDRPERSSSCLLLITCLFSVSRSPFVSSAAPDSVSVQCVGSHSITGRILCSAYFVFDPFVVLTQALLLVFFPRYYRRHSLLPQKCELLPGRSQIAVAHNYQKAPVPSSCLKSSCLPATFDFLWPSCWWPSGKSLLPSSCFGRSSSSASWRICKIVSVLSVPQPLFVWKWCLFVSNYYTGHKI